MEATKGSGSGKQALKTRAREALIARLKATLSPERAALIDETGRTLSFEDNLIPSLSPQQVTALREQLGGGDGRELDVGANGERPDAHAAHSSAALACNAFGPWIGHEHQLVLDGVGGFTEPLRVEVRQRIFRGGRAPNLDCLALGSEVVVGVESKLTEPLARHRRTVWSEAYGRDSCRALLGGGWLQALDEARSGEYAPSYLDVDQLLKHALGLSKQHLERERHLFYVYWEPTNGDELEEIGTHRDELQALRERVGDGSPRLHALTYAELWQQWEKVPGAPWLDSALAELRARYEIAV